MEVIPMSNSANLTTQKQHPKFSVAITTKGYQQLIANTLRDPNRQKRFVASITAAVAVNAELQKCEAGSILACALLGESLNLSPSPQLGQYYLAPFECKIKGPDGKTVWLTDNNGNFVTDEKGKRVPATEKKAQFILGYRGYIQLALRTGQYRDLDVMEIKEGEFLGRDRLTGRPKFLFIEDEEEREAAATIGYMAFFEYLNGFTKILYWTKPKMLRHADQYAPSFSASAYMKILNGEIPDKEMWKYSSFWYKDFDSMAKKTMLRQLISKWGIMSTEMQTAFEKDSSMAEISVDSGEILTTPEENLMFTEPEAIEAVPTVNLDEL